MKKYIVENKKTLLALVINIALIIMELIGIIICINEMNPWTTLFVYYTEDSNIFLLLTCILTSVYLIIKLIKKEPLPKYVLMLKYMSVSTVIETFLIVVFVLGFMLEGPNGMNGHVYCLFIGSMLYHHFLCPVIGFLSFVLLEQEKEVQFSFKDTIIAMAPTLVYGSIAIFLNIIKVWEGPYPFLLVYEQSILMSIVWCILVLGCAYLITIGVNVAYNKINKKLMN